MLKTSFYCRRLLGICQQTSKPECISAVLRGVALQQPASNNSSSKLTNGSHNSSSPVGAAAITSGRLYLTCCFHLCSSSSVLKHHSRVHGHSPSALRCTVWRAGPSQQCIGAVLGGDASTAWPGISRGPVRMHCQPSSSNSTWSNSSNATMTARPQLAPQQLTGLIRAAKTPTRLLQLVKQHAKAINTIHTATAFSCLGRMCKQTKKLVQHADVQELLQLLCQLAEQQLQDFGAWALCSSIHACYYLSCTPPVQLLLPRLLQPDVLPTATAQGIANVLWAVAKAGLPLQPEQSQQLLAAFDYQTEHANPQALSNVLLAAVELDGQLSARQLARTLAALVQQLHTVVPRDVANTLWACARMRIYPYKLFTSLQEQPLVLQAVAEAANPQELANMVWACGQVACQQPQLPAALLQQAARRAQQQGSGFKGQELCNLCWAAAVLGLQQSNQHALQLAASCRALWGSLVPSELQQLYQVHLWLLDCQLPAGGQGLSGVLSQQQLDACRLSWEQQLAAKATASRASLMHVAVFDALKRLPESMWEQLPIMEQVTPDGAISIDIAAVTAGGKLLAIEVDGPYHFIRPGRKLDGPTQYRNRALMARGYTVVSVPHWDWDALASSDQQEQYLLRRLSAAGSAG